MRLKKKILGLLIISFSFLVFHDFVFEYIDPCSENVVCIDELDKKELDTACQLHADIHHSFFLLDFINISFADLKKEEVNYSENPYNDHLEISIFHPPAIV
ncbi:hypothetical protein [Nitrosophilus labii]|uniref:hypothetical protein n=1 Tax=Nitrosophilus labii TaxID=2706014 RepID=UPI001656A382|nr:hypothetical protein [Nitrosophilus labii]